MVKQLIKKLCLKNKVLHNYIYLPYSAYCEKRRQRLADESNYHLSDAEYCLRNVQRAQGVNFWFLLEQGHNNIGDIAIGIAEKKFFERYYPDIPKHFIYEQVYARYERKIARQIHPGDVIVLRGGGSIGNTVQHEKHRERIIKTYLDQLIISMPQTMCFPGTDKGHQEAERARKVYSIHQKLLLVAREEQSFRDMKVLFPDNKVILTPDIVMSLNCCFPTERRGGILLCFRNDWEKNVSNERICMIQELCESLSGNTQFTDMYAAEEFVPIEFRERVFLQKIEQFKRTSLVVTDRLHSMVFSAITGTPCVALPNYNHKVRETYRWLQQLPYIRFCETPEDAIRVIPELYRSGGGSYDSQFSEPYFEEIVNYINSYLK